MRIRSGRNLAGKKKAVYATGPGLSPGFGNAIKANLQQMKKALKQAPAGADRKHPE